MISTRPGCADKADHLLSWWFVKGKEFHKPTGPGILFSSISLSVARVNQNCLEQDGDDEDNR